MFIKCDDVTDALLIFNRLKHRDAQAFGSLMKMFNRRQEPLKTLDLYQRMKKENIVATEMIFVLILDACAHIGHLSLAQSIANQIPKQFSSNRWINNASIDMWVR
jgi:pentatricopeptide repeat protein